MMLPIVMYIFHSIGKAKSILTLVGARCVWGFKLQDLLALETEYLGSMIQAEGTKVS